MGRIFMTMLAGAAAGLLAWIIWEPQFPGSIFSPAWPAVERNFIATLGALVGMSVAGLRGWVQGSKVHALRGAGVGLALGLIGGLLGYSFGGGLVAALFGPSIFTSPEEPMVKVTLARMLAFAPFGLMLGASVGAASLSARQVVVGLIGGALGAAMGAALFDPIGKAIGSATLMARGSDMRAGQEVGGVSRAVTAVLIGGCIGLLTALLERATRHAWVRLVLGRNEGKEWLVDAPQTFIGRSERAHIPLFGDQNIMPMHASIVRQGPQYVLVDGGSPIGTGLNGQRVGQAGLNPGDVIQIAGLNLQFMMRSGSPPPMPAERLAAMQMPMQPISVGPTPQQAMPADPMPTVSRPHVFTLVATNGPLAGQRFPISAPVELGRESAAVPMNFDSMASRRHAALTPGPAGLVVSDLNSTNGTLVNGAKVTSQVLKPGDSIQIGATTFRIE